MFYLTSERYNIIILIIINMILYYTFITSAIVGSGDGIIGHNIIDLDKETRNEGEKEHVFSRIA